MIYDHFCRLINQVQAWLSLALKVTYPISCLWEKKDYSQVDCITVDIEPQKQFNMANDTNTLDLRYETKYSKNLWDFVQKNTPIQKQIQDLGFSIKCECSKKNDLIYSCMCCPTIQKIYKEVIVEYYFHESINTGHSSGFIIKIIGLTHLFS